MKKLFTPALSLGVCILIAQLGGGASKSFARDANQTFLDAEAEQYGPYLLGSWSCKRGSRFLIRLDWNADSYAFEIRGPGGGLFYTEIGTFRISRQPRPSHNAMNDFSIMQYATHDAARYIGHGMVTVFTPQKTQGPIDANIRALLELEGIGSLSSPRQFVTSISVCRNCATPEKHLSLVDQSRANGMFYNFDPTD